MITPSLRHDVCISILRLLSFLLIVLSLSAFAVHSNAAGAKQHKPKKDYAVIVGTVWGPDDRPVYGVKVKIRRAQDKKAKWELYSDHHGEFAQRLPVGKADYLVTADLKDFKPNDGKPLHQVQEVTVHIDSNERIDIGLHLTH
ncbi:MAG: carboxypeptidase-like regulatory domain-containing protein [Acidobacteriia bacterium]|nr:carboxypeptidase-like regulatory domain-containing protein [Terriglobia bacterium]